MNIKIFNLLDSLLAAADSHLQQQLDKNERPLVERISRVAAFLQTLAPSEPDPQSTAGSQNLGANGGAAAAAEQKEGANKAAFENLVASFLVYAIKELQKLMTFRDHPVYKELENKHKDFGSVYKELEIQHQEAVTKLQKRLQNNRVLVNYYAIIFYLGKSLGNFECAEYQTYLQHFLDHTKKHTSKPKPKNGPKTLIPSMQGLLEQNSRGYTDEIYRLFHEFNVEKLQTALLKKFREQVKSLEDKQKVLQTKILSHETKQQQRPLIHEEKTELHENKAAFARCNKDINSSKNLIETIASISKNDPNFELKILLLCSLYLGRHPAHWNQYQYFSTFTEESRNAKFRLTEIKIDDVVIQVGNFTQSQDEEFSFLTSNLTTILGSPTICNLEYIKKQLSKTNEYLQNCDKTNALIQLNHDILALVEISIFFGDKRKIYDFENIYQACLADLRQLQAGNQPLIVAAAALSAASAPAEHKQQEGGAALVAVQESRLESLKRQRNKLAEQLAQITAQLAQVDKEINHEESLANANGQAAVSVSPISPSFSHTLLTAAQTSSKGQQPCPVQPPEKTDLPAVDDHDSEPGAPATTLTIG